MQKQKLIFFFLCVLYFSGFTQTATNIEISNYLAKNLNLYHEINHLKPNRNGYLRKSDTISDFPILIGKKHGLTYRYELYTASNDSIKITYIGSAQQLKSSTSI